MATDLATDRLHLGTLELAERDREAAQAVASGFRDAKAENTRRVYCSAWRQFQAWAEAGGHAVMPTTPQTVALYLGHLTATGRSIAGVQQARSAISHFHGAAGMQKGDNFFRGAGQRYRGGWLASPTLDCSLPLGFCYLNPLLAL